MKRKTIIIAVIFFTQVFAVFSQEVAESRFRKHAVGFSVGSLSGWGPSYKYFSEKAGIQINSFLYMRGDQTAVNSDRIVASLGGSLMYSIQRAEKINVFVHMSAGYNYSKRNSYFGWSGWGYNENRNFSIGPGLGVEFQSDWLGMNFYYGIGFNRNFSAFSMLQAGCSLFFYF